MAKPKWPEDKSKCAKFDELVEPVLDAIRQAYRLERTQETGIEWKGLPCTEPHLLAMCLDHRYQLDEDGLKYHHDQGRDPLHAIISVAVRLGMEQGIRLCKLKNVAHVLHHDEE